MFYKTSTQKEKAYDFYNSYEGEKVSRPTFYYRVRLGWDKSWEERIQKAKWYKRRECAPKGKRATEMTWYNEQPEPKASKSLFRNRLNNWYSKEEAILIGDKWMGIRAEKKPKKAQLPKTYIPKKTIQKEPDESNFKIEITLSKEEARVFRKEYVGMIEQIERELTYTEEKTEVAWLNEKLKRLQNELQIFNSYNK